jgi:hypothetical protein
MAAAALLVGWAGFTEAATLYSAPADTLVNPGAVTAHRLCCDIVNTSSRTAIVTIEIRDRAGDVVMSAPVSLDPEKGTSRCVTAGAAYCQFEVPGSSRLFRAMAIYDAAGRYRIALPAR